MHPVIKHLLARRNKSVPVKDGRNIALVNLGGFMAGIRNAGAMLALVEMGYENAFDSIYTISSGFSNASSFLSGDGRRNISVYYEDLCTGHFLKPKRFWKMVNLDYLVNILKFKKPLNVTQILKQQTKLFILLKNKNKNINEYVEVHNFPKAKYFNLIKAASSMPFLSPGYIKVGHNYYKDPFSTAGQITAHLKYVLATDASDIFVIYNQYSDYFYAKKRLKAFGQKKILHIYPPKGSILSSFENRPEVLKQEAKLMGRTVKNLFGLKRDINLYETKA